MILGCNFSFEVSFTNPNQYSVFKYFEIRKGIKWFLPVAQIEKTDNINKVTFFNSSNLTEEEKKYILNKSEKLNFS